MRLGLRSAVLAIAATAVLALALPAVAAATKVGLSALVVPPSKCFAPQQNAYASTSCQVFYGASLQILSLASRDDGSARLAPQTFTLLALEGEGETKVVKSFTVLDENESDDEPFVAPRRNIDYRLRFEGNSEMAPGTSATMVVEVGAEVTTPRTASTGSGSFVNIPAEVVVPDRVLGGKLELRRCHRSKAHTASSCARRSSYTVIARRIVNSTNQFVFTVATPPRSFGRYEIAFQPRSKRFETTRRAFDLTRGFDGKVSYRPTARRSPFGNR